MFKKRLNNQEIKEKEMELAEETNYEALRYFMNNKRVYVKLKRDEHPEDYAKRIEGGKDGLVEKRLISLEYITFDENSPELEFPDFIITKEGYKKFQKLREIYQKDWSKWNKRASIIIIIATIINLYLIGKAQGWW